MAIETAEHNTRKLHQSLSRAEETSAVQWIARPGDSNQCGEVQAAGMPRPQLRKTPGWKRNYRCFRCLSERHGSNECPFKIKRCFECSKVGHTRAAHKDGAILEFEDVSPSVPGSTQDDTGE